MSSRREILEEYSEATRPRRRPWIDGARVFEAPSYRRGPARADPLVQLEQLHAGAGALERSAGARVAFSRFVSTSPHFPCQRCRPGILGLCSEGRRLWLAR